MLRPALAALTALALAFAALVAPATIAPVDTASAAVSGSATLFPTGGSTCGPTDANPCRAAIEWRTNSYGPTGPGETQVKRRTMFSVYAVAGERILVGSSSMGALTEGTGNQADIVMWNPGLISETGVNTVANSALPTPSYSCLAQRSSSGDASLGILDRRAKELAGPNSISGNNNAAGYKPCYYTAPTTGIYRLAFYGTAGNLAGNNGTPSSIIAPAGGAQFPNPGGSSAVDAWDITVRAASTSSTTNIDGRVYTYSFAFFTGNNPRPVLSSTYLNTTDGFRYRVDMRGLDGNGYAYYGNRSGFLDADGTPLNHDVLGTSSNPANLETLKGGTHLAPPEYPLSLQPLAAETLAALAIPTSPTNPVLNSVTYSGKKTTSGSYLDQGGTFTVDTGTSGTYEIVLSRTGTNFDPGLPANATIRGVVNAAGVYTVAWDGKDNKGDPFPVGDDYVVHSTLRGGEYHAPMLDIESSYYGGPTITLENPPSGICPFSGATSTGSNCTRAFFDDRGYTTSSGVDVGTPGGAICANFTGTVPNPLFSDPVTGFDSSGSARAFGTQASTNANTECPATNGTLGDAKGLDVWTFFPSAVQSTEADVLPLPATPDAANDSATTPVGTTLTRAAQGVLVNDVGTNLTVTGHTAPASGSLTINADGSYSYVPVAGFTGTVTSTYTITDDAGQTDTAVLTITVTPRGVDDSATTPAGTTLTRTVGNGVLQNDQGTGLTTAGFTPLPAGTGSLILNANGSYSYVPPAGFSGIVSTTYTLRDANNQTATAVLTISVTPVAVNDTDTTRAGTALSRNATQGVLADDTGSGLTVTGFTPLPASEGALTINLDGSYSFTPAAGFSGVTSTTYTATDADGQSTTATLTITVNPDAVNETVTTPYGFAYVGGAPGVLANDLGTDLRVLSYTNPSSGSFTMSTNGSFTFVPATGFSGVVTVPYTVADSGNRTDSAVLTIRVGPHAVDDTDTTTAGTAITRGAAAGVLDDDLGPSITVTSHTQPSSGTLDIDADGSYTYTPATGFSGIVSADYTITDANGLTDIATLVINVTPVAVNDTDTTRSGVTLVRAASGGVLTDDTGTGLTVTGYTQPASGVLDITADGAYVYSATPGFSGQVTSTYTVRDADGQSTTATLTITVTPLASNDQDATSAGTAITRTGSPLFVNDGGTGIEVTARTATPAGVGTLDIEPDGDYSYTPAPGYSGTFSVQYTITDDEGRSDSATLTITVSPRAIADTDTTVAGTAISRNAAAGVLPDDLGTDLIVTGHTPIPAGQGILTIDADGSYDYTPAVGFSGDVVTTYTVEDAAGGTATTTLTITVTPLATDDADATVAGTSISRDAANGVLPDDLGTGLTVTGFTAPASGTLTINADGSYSYAPAAGFSGDVQSTYTVTDTSNRTATAVLSIRVDPLAVDDSASTPHGQTLTRTGADGVLGNDRGQGLTVVSHTSVPAARGTLDLASDGSYEFVPAAGFSGVVTTDYTVRDSAGRTATATLTIAVGLAAVDDDDTTTVDTPISRDAANGVLPDDGGTGLEVTGFTAPSSGTLTIAADGSYSYTPAAGFSGIVTSTYTVTDDDAQTDTAVLTIRVTPVAADDTDATTAGTAITRDAASGVLPDDRGTDLEVTGFTAPASGTLAIAADGSYSYTPAAGFSGVVTSSYTIEDAAGQSTTAMLTITVTPVAVADTDTTTHGTTLTRTGGSGVLGDDLGTGLTVTGHTAPASGSLTIAADGSYTYTPVSGFSGQVVSTYTIEDAIGQTTTATLTISVTPVAVDDADATTADTAISRDAASGVLPDDLGSALTVTGHTAPASGTLVIASDGSYSYTPAAGFSGVVTSTYTVEDAAGQQTTATLEITVTPVAVADTDTTTAGTPLARNAASGVLADDLGSALTVTGHTAPASGTLAIASNGSYSYAPAAGFSGVVTSTYTVEDASGQTTTATLTITVTPVATDDTDATTAGSAISRDAAAGVLTDDTGSGLQVIGHTAPASGALTIAADGAYDYTPATGFSGTVSSTYTVRDTSGQETTAALEITVTPVAVDDTDATVVGTDIARDAAAGVLADDLGSGLTVTGHTAAAHGTLTIAADGSYSYAPDAGFSGTDSVVYTVRDSSGQTTTATLIVTVSPVGGDDVATTPAETTLVVPAPGVLDNDAGTTLAVTGFTQPSTGVVSMSSDGSYSYTPPAGFSGVTTFTYTAADGTGSYTQTVTITVTPVAVDDTAEGDVDEPIVLSPADLTGDDLGTTLEVTGATDGAHGTVEVAADRTVTYTPEPGFSGQDTFTYTITGAGGTSTATVTVVVKPSAPDDEIRTKVDQKVDSVSGRLLANARGTGLTVHGVTQPAHGTVVVDADGTFHYTPAPGYTGTDAFTYSLVDSFGTVVTGTVRITVVPELPFTGADPRIWTGAALLTLLAGAVLLLARRRRGKHAA